MSAVPQLVLSAGKKVADFVRLGRKGSIGDISIAALLEETHDDELVLTDHPVERGAQITDHSYKKPVEVCLRCGWTNSTLDALVSSAITLVTTGKITKSDYVSAIYSQLLALQEARELVSIATTLRQYDSMLIQALNVTRDKSTAEALMVTATFREIRLVTTQSTTLPARELQLTPQSTAEVEKAGLKSLTNKTVPSPRGAVGPVDW